MPVSSATRRVDVVFNISCNRQRCCQSIGGPTPVHPDRATLCNASIDIRQTLQFDDTPHSRVFGATCNLLLTFPIISPRTRIQIDLSYHNRDVSLRHYDIVTLRMILLLCGRSTGHQGRSSPSRTAGAPPDLISAHPRADGRPFRSASLQPK